MQYFLFNFYYIIKMLSFGGFKSNMLRESYESKRAEAIAKAAKNALG